MSQKTAVYTTDARPSPAWSETDHRRAAAVLKTCYKQIMELCNTVSLAGFSTPAQELDDAANCVFRAMSALDAEHARLRVSPYAPVFPGQQDGEDGNGGLLT